MRLPADPAASDAPADARGSTLAAFVQRNRVELMARCQVKAAQRHAPRSPPPATSSGVACFLQQLVDVLETERAAGPADAPQGQHEPGTPEIGQTAAAHGTALLQQGFTVDQVVRGYGDVCQSVTELALAQDTRISTDEFRILNGCLDNAIAEAVTAYQNVAQQTLIDGQAGQHLKLRMLMHDHQRLVGIARHSFQAIKSGHVGITGATSNLLAHALDELLQLSETRLPQVVEVLRKKAQ